MPNEVDPSKCVDLTLSRIDRELIRKYGYPFPSIEASINAVAPEEDVVVVACERAWIEHLLGDLAYSINRCKDSRLQDRLNELYESIENELRSPS